MNNGLYQKKIKKYQFLMAAFLVAIPVLINASKEVGLDTWKTFSVILFMSGCVFFFYRTVQECKKLIEEASYQLTVGSKVLKKYHSKRPQEVYYIFQEGHRYYYLENIKSGDKRLVAKDKIFNDYDLIDSNQEPQTAI